MKLNKIAYVVGVMLAGLSTQALAVTQGFTLLPDLDTTALATSKNPVNTVTKLTKTGAANNAADILYAGQYTGGASVFSKVPTTFSLLDSRITTTLPFTNKAGQAVNMGSFYDAVYRDTTDGNLVFASRLELTPSSGVEINNIFRRGYSAFTYANHSEVDVEWSNATAADFRLKSAAKSDQGLLKLFNANGVQTGTAAAHYNADVINLATDTSAPESNPISGWYFIKVKDGNADETVSWSLVNNAVGLYRGNDEPNGVITTYNFAGFMPLITSKVVIPTPVPEPSEYAMLLAGLGLVGWAARRRYA